MNKNKGRATWDVSSTRIFINACIEQIYNKQRRGTSFTNPGWNNIVSTFIEKSGKSYEKKQLKNRLDILRREWRTWEALFSKESGIGWDPARNRVVATDEWWQRKIRENKLYEKYRYNGMMFARELKIIFKDVMAYGEDMFVPSSTQPQTPWDSHDDVYRPTIDQEEGSGDSEEEHFGVNPGVGARVTDGLIGINLTTNISNSAPSGPSSSRSHGKRKMGEGLCRNKKQKVASSRQIVDAISITATVSKDTTTTVNKVNDASISEVIPELINIEEITRDSDLRNRCLKLMMYETCREMFVALKGHRDYLIKWLQDMAYNPPSWLKPPPP